MKKLFLFLFALALFSESFAQEHHMGVNMPFRDTEIGMSKIMPLLREVGIKYYRHLTYTDVDWKLVEPQDNQWNFEFSDSAFFNPFGITPLPTLYSYFVGLDTVGLQVPWKACSSTACGWHPADSVDSKDYVQTVVNRYKSATKYWEISNEVDGHRKRPIGLPIKSYADFLKMNYRWIKETDPKAKVLIAGLSGTYGLPLGDYSWLKGILNAGAGNYFDILSYHDYNSWWTLPKHVEMMHEVLQTYGLDNKPFWVTECSVSSSRTNISPKYSSADGQAADVWRRTAVLFASGVEKFFWHPFWSGKFRPWFEFGVIDTAGVKKKSFYSLQLLIEEIDTFATAQKISFGDVTNDNNNGGNGIWAVKFTFTNGLSKWVLWSPNELSYNLNVSQGFNAVEVTNIVPYYISPDGESALFKRDTLTLEKGQVTLSLTDYPVLVKGINITTAEKDKSTPANFSLAQNYPNPFGLGKNFETSIRFSVPQQGNVVLKVYDVLGREVKTLVNSVKNAGTYKIHFSGEGLTPGIYFYTLQTGSFTSTRKMILLK